MLLLLLLLLGLAEEGYWGGYDDAGGKKHRVGAIVYIFG